MFLCNVFAFFNYVFFGHRPFTYVNQKFSQKSDKSLQTMAQVTSVYWEAIIDCLCWEWVPGPLDNTQK